VFDYGADISVHSLTKYIGGHDTTIGGAALSPHSAFLIMQGLETLGLRRSRHCENAEKSCTAPVATTAGQLGQLRRVRRQSVPREQREVLRVWRPGILSFGIQGGIAAGMRFIDALQLILRPVTVGDAKSLACHPASTTHRPLNAAELASAGVREDMGRLSIGIEHIDDILGDIDQA
jgi:O-acetylhomoserine (thiol)-lyase